MEDQHEQQVTKCTGQLILDALIDMDTDHNDFVLSNDQFQLFEPRPDDPPNAFGPTSDEPRLSPTSAFNADTNPFSVDRSLDDFLANVENENLE
jgi:hypothetical protein